MVLRKFCPIYTRSEFRVVEVVAEVKEAMKKGPDAALQALDILSAVNTPGSAIVLVMSR